MWKRFIAGDALPNSHGERVVKKSDVEDFLSGVVATGPSSPFGTTFSKTFAMIVLSRILGESGRSKLADSQLRFSNNALPLLAFLVPLL